MAKYEVNIDVANSAKKEMVEIMKTKNKNIINLPGSFSALYDLSGSKVKEPVLVLKTEEPGSKQYLAAQYDKFESICADMINHLINDCIVMGATPLSVQDAIICGKLDQQIINRMVKAMKSICDENGCDLTGGETSEQPGILDADKYILTSSIIGIVEKSQIIDGTAIEENDIVIGLESSGIHTNGYTLVRTIMKECPEIINETVNGNSFIDEVLVPHRCYYTALKDLFGEGVITGMAHITGGGIKENLNRILPNHLSACINLGKYNILPIFKLLKRMGNVSSEEMLRVFNLGVGMVVTAREKDSDYIVQHLKSKNVKCSKIGYIKPGYKTVCTEGSFNWD